MRRAGGIAVRFLAAVAAMLALLVVVAAWRLASGPVSLDVLAPYVARALGVPGGAQVVSVDHTWLSLAADGQIELRARGVHLRQGQEAAELLAPELALAFSMSAALTGTIAPTRIALVDPALRLRRDADGSFHLNFGDTDTATAEDWAASLFRDLAAAPERHGPLSYLRQLSVRHATVTVEDRSSGALWQAGGVDLSLARGSAGVVGDIALAVDANGRRAELHGDIDYQAAAARLALGLRFSDLDPAAWAGAAPGFAPLAMLDLPVAGTVRLELDTTSLRIADAWADLALGSGAIRHPALADGSLAIAAGALRASYDPAAGRVSVDRLALDLGGPQLEARGSIAGLDADILAGAWPRQLDVAADLKAAALPVNDFPRLWPEGLGPSTRSWVVDHIHDGAVDEAVMHVGLHVELPPGQALVVRCEQLDGTLAYHGLTVDYFKPLAPARGVDGTASFDRSRIDFVPIRGRVRDVNVSGGLVHLYQLDTNDEQAAIDLAVHGPLRDVMAVLDTKPLEYAREIGVVPGKVAGDADGHLHFNFPLKRDLQLAEVDYGADAKLKGVAIGDAIAGRDLSGGDFTLALDRAAAKLDGTAQLADVPISLNWTQSLKPQSAVRTRYTVHARLDDDARRALGLDFAGGMVAGPIDAALAYAVDKDKRGKANLDLDLTPARVAIDKLGWTKPAGVAANAKVALDLDHDRLTGITSAALSGGGMDLRLSAEFGAVGDGQGLTRIDVSRLVTGDTDVTGVITRRAEGGWRVVLRGPRFDASALLAEQSRAAAAEAQEPPLIIEAQLDRLVLGPKREARAVSGQLFSDGTHWQAASIDAGMFDGGTMSLRFGTVAGAANFRLTTDDFGALLRLFDISDNVAGGQCQITGRVEDAGASRVLRGRIEGADYKMVGAPLFARLLAAASFSGISALLSGEGIPFTRLTADFTYGDGRIEADNLRAYGGAIGINASGSIDLRGNALDVSGTLVPAYTLNSVLGNIPVLGSLLMGGEGEGLFGANFRIAGSLADAHIAVNPLSALAPGVLRKLFLFEPWNPAPAPNGPRPGEAKQGP